MTCHDLPEVRDELDKDANYPALRWTMDWRRIEVMDEAMGEVLRRKTPAERLAIGFGLWRSAQKILRGQLASLHPEWDARRLDREVARRLSHGAV